MRSLILLITVAASYYFLRGFPEGWPPVLRICLSGVILVLGIALWGNANSIKTQETTPERQPGWLDYLSVGLAVLSLEAILLFFFASAPEKLEELARNLDLKLHPESYPSLATEDQPGVGKSDLRQASGNWLWQNNGQRTLGSRGKIRPSNRPEVFLWPLEESDFAALENDLYLRSFTLSRYRSGSWRARPIAPKGLSREDKMIPIRTPDSRDLRYEISHGPNASEQSLVVGIPEITGVGLDRIRRIAPDTFRLPPLPENETHYRYPLTSRPLFFDPRTDSPAEDAPDELAAPTNLELDSQLNFFSAQFVGTPPQKLASLKSFLANRCRYSLETNFDPEADIMQEFLFTHRVGYCEHFATAAALLARKIGYPARIAYGWSGGRYYPNSGMYVFRAKEAHAWTEVKVAGKGWVIFEATPQSREEGQTSMADQNEKPPIPGGFGADLSNASISVFPDPEGLFGFGLSGTGILKISSLIAAVLGLMALTILAPVKQRGKSTDLENPGSPLLPQVSNYFRSFQKACAMLGHPMPPGHTLQAQLSDLEAAGASPDLAHELLTYHYGVHYSEEAPDKAKERQLLKKIQAWGATKVTYKKGREQTSSLSDSRNVLPPPPPTNPPKKPCIRHLPD